MLAYAITTYNEEKNIKQCIESLLSANINLKHIYIVDSLSTDNTLDICAEYDVKILSNKFIDMATQRNFAFEKISAIDASVKYVCILDADEVLTSEFHSELKTLLDINSDISSPAAVAVCRKMYFADQWVKGASNYPVFIDRVGHVKLHRWKNVGHGEILDAKIKLNLNTPLVEKDHKDIYSILNKHVKYAYDEATEPIKNGKKSYMKEAVLSLRGSYFFIVLYAIYLYIFRGVAIRGRKERDYAAIKLIYEIQILLIKRYNE